MKPEAETYLFGHAPQADRDCAESFVREIVQEMHIPTPRGVVARWTKSSGAGCASLRDPLSITSSMSLSPCVDN
jgi:hypothetical protein